MKKNYFISIFTFCLFFTFSFGQTSDINISKTGFADTEPYLAVNPANPNNIIAAWMHLNPSLKMSIYTKTSFDSGVTWGNQNSLPHLSFSFTSADVSIAFNKAGEAFISYVDYKLTIDSGYVRVAKSTNGGISWSNPVNAVAGNDSPDKPVDRPWIVADQSNGSYSGRLYIVSKSYYAVSPPQKVWLTISSDSGKTWSAIKQLDDSIPTGLTNIMGTPAVGADGSLYVAYISYKPLLSPAIRVICTKSTNGGNTFTRHDVMHYAGNSANTDTLYQGSYSLSANPTNAGNVIFQCTDSRNGDMDVLSVFSNDGGVTWSATPTCINNDGTGNGYGQDMSWSSFSPQGIYAIAWRDRRNGITNDTSKFEIYTSLSADGGATFSPNYKLSSAQSSFVNIQRGNDFLGAGLNSNYVFSDWCDIRTGNTEIFFRQELISTVMSVHPIEQKDLELSIYPNPLSTTAELTVFNRNKTITSELEIKIYDVFGKEVPQFINQQFTLTKDQIRSFTIQRNNIPSGVYFIQLKQGNKIAATKKIVVI